jgi:ribonuclease VapC
MILDSSAILSLLLREPGFEDLVDQIASASQLAVGAPTLAESGIVLTGRIGQNARSLLVHFIHEWKIEVIPFSEDHWQEAVAAYSQYGKGKHKAALNFGDCMTFAVAKVSGRPLLCTGSDFSRTDLELVMRRESH